jgi:antitoxin component of MazEF toxin-antitoxin module
VKATRFTRRTKLETIEEAVFTVRAKDQVAAREIIERLEKQRRLDEAADFVERPEDFDSDEVEGELSTKVVARFLGEVQLDPGEEPNVSVAGRRAVHQRSSRVRATLEEKAALLASRQRAAQEDFQEKVGVHARHCCKRHGCKYGEDDCPVVKGRVVQDGPCHDCRPRSA